MTEWKEYTGSDEQIAELKDALNSYGFITSRISGIRWNKQVIPSEITLNEVFEFATEYLIIPDDPLREMKIRQARTGQPVWYNHKFIPPHQINPPFSFRSSKKQKESWYLSGT